VSTLSFIVGDEIGSSTYSNNTLYSGGYPQALCRTSAKLKPD
jgi:hypothetical protein